MKVTIEKINTDEHYARVAKNWEGDMHLVLEPDDRLHEHTWLLTSKTNHRPRPRHLY